MTPNKDGSAAGTSCGNADNSTGTLDLISAFGLTAITTGKPVRIWLQPDNSAGANAAFLGVVSATGAACQADFRLYRDGVQIAFWALAAQASGATVLSTRWGPGTIDFTDFGVENLPGSYLYTLKVQKQLGDTVYIRYSTMFVREIGV